MGSIKKGSSPGIVVWCVVLGLALLVVEAAAQDLDYCQDLCRAYRGSDKIRCINDCIRSPGHGVAARLALQRRAAGGTGAGKLAAFQPGTAAYCRQFCEYAWNFAACNIECLGKKETRGVGGRKEEKKMKQEDLVLHLTDPAYSYCSDYCNGREGEDHQQCIIDCYSDLSEGLAAHGGAGGAVDATAADALTRCIRYCERRGADGRCQEWRCLRLHQAGWKSTQAKEEEEETRGGAFCVCQHRAADGHCEAWRCRRLRKAGLESTQTQEQLEETRGEAPSRGFCEASCQKHYDASSPGYAHCMNMCRRLAAHGVAQGEEAAAGGRGAGQEDAPSA